MTSIAAIVVVALVVGLTCRRPGLPERLPERPAEPHWTGGATTLDRPRVEVPVAIEGDVPFVHVWLDGRGPYRFLVDTGCSFAAVVDDGVVEALGLTIVGETDNSDGAGHVEFRDLAAVGELDLGGARFTDLEVLVDDLTVFEPVGDVDGLLGFALLTDLLASLDYPRGVLALERGALDPADDHVVEFVDRYGAPHVPLTIGAERLRVLVDTGSPLSLTLPGVVRHRFGFHDDLRRAGRVRTLYAELEWWRGTLAEPATLAGRTHDDLDAHVFTPSTEASIGGALLRDRTLVIDTANGLVALR